MEVMIGVMAILVRIMVEAEVVAVANEKKHLSLVEPVPMAVFECGTI